jgi:hypothetical protein
MDASVERGVLKRSLGVLGLRRPESTGAWDSVSDAMISDDRISLIAALQEYRSFVERVH